jgi:hypothetical protein
MLSWRLLRASALVLLAGVVLTALPRARAEERGKVRHVLAALHEMREARGELKGAEHDFGGHREKAIRALDAAIEQTERMLKAVDVDPKVEGPDREIYKKYTNHPHLRHSLVELKEARTEIKEAGHDFKGHREKALKDLDFAIEQVEQCVKHIK